VTGARGSHVAGSLANQIWQMLGGPPNLQGETLTKGRHLRLRFPIPFNRANIHAGLAHVVLTVMLETDVAQFSELIGSGLRKILHRDSGERPFHALG
jgi:hypothetical protein